MRRPSIEEIPNGLRGRGGQRALPVPLRDLGVLCPPVQIAQHGVPQIRAGQPGRRGDGLQQRESGFRSLTFGDGNRPVHCVQRPPSPTSPLRDRRRHPSVAVFRAARARATRTHSLSTQRREIRDDVGALRIVRHLDRRHRPALRRIVVFLVACVAIGAGVDQKPHHL